MSFEAKRPSTSQTKVPIALPKAEAAQPASTNLVSQDVSLQMAVGSRVRVTTTVPNHAPVEGTVYTADATTGLLVLNLSTTNSSSISPTSLTAPAGAYRFIPMSQISSFQILNLLQPTDTSKSTFTSPSNALDTNALSKRLDKAIQTAQTLQSQKGPKGTTPVDQDLFDALAKTHPAYWQGTNMVISDVFTIEKPYEKANVKLIPGTTGALDRMRTIVDIERKKATLKQPLDLPNLNAGKTKGG